MTKLEKRIALVEKRFNEYRGKYKPSYVDCSVFPLRKWIDDKELLDSYNKIIEKRYALEKDFEKYQPHDHAWWLFLGALRRARYMQVTYYPTMDEIKTEEYRLKCAVRMYTKTLCKQGKIKMKKYCEVCKTRTAKLLKHHPEPCNPTKIMTMCYPCHAKWHRDHRV